MSTQSSSQTATAKKCNMYENAGSGSSTATATNANVYQYLSNSQIAQAADEAFSHHKRLDAGTGYCDGSLDVGSNPLDTPSSKSRLQLRKRKNKFEQVPSAYNTDFVSGIFRDLSQAENDEDVNLDPLNGNHNVNTESHSSGMNCISDDEYSQAKKRLKSGNFGSLRRSQQSFSNLRNLTNANGNNLSSAIPSPFHNRTTTDATLSSETVSYKVNPCGRNVSVTSQESNTTMISDATIDTDLINNLVDKVLFDSIVFPCLPHTVSESSCSSNNLTQTAVQAAQVLETPSKPHIEGKKQKKKDSYGWFVDMDLESDGDRADAITAAQAKCRSGSDDNDDLSFRAFTAPKKTTELDQEVEWAKAADTVDDVLGDFF